MPYIAKNLDIQDMSKPVEDGQCVALVRAWAGAPVSSIWMPGARVAGNHGIVKGTAIATFVDGHYPNHPSGNHAAIYVGQDSHGIRVVDQWAGHKPSERIISFHDGGSLSNNGAAFSVIE